MNNDITLRLVLSKAVMCCWKTLLWLELSNSGDTLKLMIPNYIRKIISGQHNYLGMVTSHKMIENEMGYRGSKSKMVQATQSPSPVFVKEQRADGSYLGLIPRLRCALTGYKSSYQIQIPSKQFRLNQIFLFYFYK